MPFCKFKCTRVLGEVKSYYNNTQENWTFFKADWELLTKTIFNVNLKAIRRLKRNVFDWICTRSISLWTSLFIQTLADLIESWYLPLIGRRISDLAASHLILETSLSSIRPFLGDHNWTVFYFSWGLPRACLETSLKYVPPISDFSDHY